MELLLLFFSSKCFNHHQTISKKLLVVTHLHTVYLVQTGTELGESGFFKQKWTYLPVLKVYQQKTLSAADCKININNCNITWPSTEGSKVQHFFPIKCNLISTILFYVFMFDILFLFYRKLHSFCLFIIHYCESLHCHHVFKFQSHKPRMMMFSSAESNFNLKCTQENSMLFFYLSSASLMASDTSKT